MTRINVVPVSELSDQHLIAEYHELPRVLKQNINITDAPEQYCLGKGHMKWGKLHAGYCVYRYLLLRKEMAYRGFKVGYDMFNLKSLEPRGYHIEQEDIELNRQRLREKYQMKPNWYRWTRRNKPDWL